MIKRSSILAFVILLGSFSAQARVFQMGNESFSTYLRGAYGPSQQNDTPFAPSGGTGTAYDSAYKTNLAYEFGFVYSTNLINWKFGFEILKPASLKSVQGSSAAGVPWYSVTNDISGYAPKIGLELNFKKWATSRFFGGVDYGQATVTVQNSYTFASAGSTQFPGMSDFREEVKGSAPIIEANLGFESLISDNATFIIDAGYRKLEMSSFSHNVDAKTFQGDVVKGDDAKNTDGTARTLSLSGAFASLSLRIYIN